MISDKKRSMTILDAIVLVAASAVGFWVSRYGLIAWLHAIFVGFDRKVWASNGLWLSWHWGSLILRYTQPMAAIFTLAALILLLSRPRPEIRQLARQPGFMACVAATLAVFIGGLLNLAMNTRTSSPGFVIQNSLMIMLLPHGSEPGIAVAATWSVAALGRSWQRERSWLDRFGRLLGIYWLAMVFIVLFATRV